MNPALVYLISRSLWNALVFRIKRLRKPKYLAGAVMGAAYFYFYFYRFLLHGFGGPRSMGHETALPLTGDTSQLGALALLLAVLLFAWIFPSSRVLLYFTEAEIAWLFPAPLQRKTLVAFKLIKSQLGTLLAAVFFSFITGRFTMGGGIWLRILGWWMIVSTFQMHRLGASFALQRLRERGLADTKRRLALLLGAGALAFALYWWGGEARAIPLPSSGGGPDAFFAYLRRLTDTGTMHALLTPFRIVVAPLFSSNPGAFLQSLWPAALILAAHYAWILRADGSFEEASVALAKTRAAFIAARSRGERGFRPVSKKARRSLFALKSTGPVITGFIWKAMIQCGGRTSFQTGAIAVAAMLGAAAAISALGWWQLARFMATGLSFVALVLSLLIPANQAVAQFRRGTELIDLIKTYPVSGWQVVGGELGATLIWATGLQSALVALIAVLIRGLSHDFADLHFPLLPFVSATTLFPGLNLVMMLVPCAAVLLLPAWFKMTRPGIEAGGMRLLLLFGQIVAMAFTLLPAALAGGAVWFLTRGSWGLEKALTAAAPVSGAVLLLEGVAGIVILGWLFDRYDVSDEE